MDMKYTPEKKNENLQETLERFDETIDKIIVRLGQQDKLYEELTKRVGVLASSQTKWGRKLGEDISVPCPGCGKQHTIPYVPGN